MSGAGAIPYFGDAYMADTRHLSLEEHGAYHLLILIAWRTPNCVLPDDDRRLAQMLGITPKKWAKLKPAVMAFWTLGEDGWQQKRLTKERQFVDKKREQNRQSANRRWNGQVIENIEPAPCERICDGNAPPPLPTEEKKREPSGSPKETKPVQGGLFEAAVLQMPAVRGTRLSEDWVLPDDWLGEAMQLRPDLGMSGVHSEAARFRDYWVAKTGANATKRDWRATFRNWIREARGGQHGSAFGVKRGGGWDPV